MHRVALTLNFSGLYKQRVKFFSNLDTICIGDLSIPFVHVFLEIRLQNSNNYEGWNFNSGNYLFTTDTK